MSEQKTVEAPTLAGKHARCVRCDRLWVLNNDGRCLFCENKETLRKRNMLGWRAVDNRSHAVEPRPFTADPVRHLHYFLYPRFEQSTAYHIEKLKRSLPQFNGKTVCCVATDAHTLHEEFAEELDAIFDVVYSVKNDPRKREVAGFIPTLEHFQSLSENDVICFAHGKGQQSHTNQNRVIRMWTDALYETVVDNWEQVEVALAAGYPLAGSFKSLGSFRSTQYRWHYSGAFWWSRSAALFSLPRWRDTCGYWWGSESYVGRHWAEWEGYCLFADQTKTSTAYYEHVWNTRFSRELDEWRSESLEPKQ